MQDQTAGQTEILCFEPENVNFSDVDIAENTGEKLGYKSCNGKSRAMFVRAATIIA